MYCRHCEEQVENCLSAARDAQNNSVRTYFLTLADKWTRLGGDLEELASCGFDCPLYKVCGHQDRAAAQPAKEAVKPMLSPAAAA